MKTCREYAKLGGAVIAASVLSLFLMIVAVPRSQADDRAQCQQRIEKAEARLQQEIREHGERSPQAENRRRELNEERERCWNEHHGWWSGQQRQWRNERDWDREHDRDHDRDRYRGNINYQSGYKEGLRIGSYDRRVGRAYQPANYKAYKNNGNADYRTGFVNGYDEGYGRRH